MRKKERRIRLGTLALAVCLLLSLTACGGDGEQATESAAVNETQTSSDVSKTTTEQAAYGYLSTVKNLDLEISWANGVMLKDDKLYLSGERYDEALMNYTYILSVMDTEGNLERNITLPDVTPAWYQTMAVGNDCIWAVTYEWVQEIPDEEEDENDDWLTEDPAEPSEDPEEELPEDWTQPDVPEDWTDTVEPAVEGWDTSSEETAEEESAAAEEDDTEWIYEEPVAEEEYYYGHECYTLLQFDMDGQLMNQKELQGPEEMEYFYVNQMAADDSGYLYLVCDMYVLVYDQNMEQVTTLTLPNWITTLVPVPGGQVLVQYYDENYEPVLAYLDASTWTVGEPVSLELANENYAYTYYAGADGTLYASSTEGLYRCNLDTGTMEELLVWLDCDVDAYSFYGIVLLEDGEVLAIGTDDLTGGVQMTTLQQVPASEIPQKTELTLGVTYLNYNARRLILSFNRSNTEYRITVRDYSQYNNEDNAYTGAQTQLERDMISGNCPDIIYLDSTASLEKYVSKGILTDLYTLMNEDTVQKEDLVESYRKTMEIDGGLYIIYPSFQVTTMYGAASVVGTEPGWTLEEFSALAQNYTGDDQAIWMYMTREDFLYSMLNYSYETFVDKDSGICSFDGEEFLALLETCMLFPEDYEKYNTMYGYDSDTGMLKAASGESFESEYDMMRAGKILTGILTISNLDSMRYYKDELADDMTLIGIPGVAGNGAVLSASGGYAISAQSAYQDVAWDFLATMLTEEYAEQNVYGLSVLQSYLEKQAQTMLEKPYYIDETTGERVEYSDEVLTQEQADKVLDVIYNVQGKANYDQSLMNIVLEETAAYFAGQKDAATVADLIQNRVQIYLDEQG